MTSAAEKLRHGRLAASVITTFIQTDRFAGGPQYYNAGTHTLAYPTDSMQEMLRCALGALERIFREIQDRKAGVILNGLTPADQLTLRTFDNSHERFRKVMVAVDQINRRWGLDTVRFAVARPDGHWRTKCLGADLDLGVPLPCFLGFDSAETGFSIQVFRFLTRPFSSASKVSICFLPSINSVS